MVQVSERPRINCLLEAGISRKKVAHAIEIASERMSVSEEEVREANGLSALRVVEL
jgi:hypothetical protein